MKNKKAFIFRIFLLLTLMVLLNGCDEESEIDENSDSDDTTGATDTTPPEITLLGANPFEISAGNTFTDPGATATDDIDGDISANIVIGGDTVDITTPGTYALTYDVSDVAGNAATQVTRTVVVSSSSTGDTTPPEITLLGDNPVEIDIASGEAFTDPGATATDDMDGDISASIVVGGDTVDTTTLGTYVVTYDVSDAAGNAASQVTRNVVIIDRDDAKIPTSFSWTPPTENSDGSDLTDLSLYRLYYGPDESSLQMVYEFSAGGSTLNFSSIPPSEYDNLVNLISQNTKHFYAMTAVNSSGIESGFSNIDEF